MYPIKWDLWWQATNLQSPISQRLDVSCPNFFLHFHRLWFRSNLFSPHLSHDLTTSVREMLVEANGPPQLCIAVFAKPHPLLGNPIKSEGLDLNPSCNYISWWNTFSFTGKFASWQIIKSLCCFTVTLKIGGCVNNVRRPTWTGS